MATARIQTIKLLIHQVWEPTSSQPAWLVRAGYQGPYGHEFAFYTRQRWIADRASAAKDRGEPVWVSYDSDRTLHGIDLPATSAEEMAKP